MNFQLNRRDFLRAGAVGLGALTLYSNRAWANALGSNWTRTAAATADFVIFVRAVGGWDVTLGLDPQVMPAGLDEKDVFLEYRADQIWLDRELRLGPSCAPLFPFKDHFSVVNGVFMSSTNFDHVALLDYASSGSRESMAAFVVQIEDGLKPSSPFGVFSNGSVQLGDKAVQQSTVDGVLQLLKSGGFGGAADYIRKSKGKGSALIDARDSLMASQKTLDQLKLDLEKKWGQLPDNALSNQQLVDLLAGIFQSGLCRAAQIDLSANLDTHAGHPANHLAAQRDAVWAPVAELLKIFSAIDVGQGRSLLDRTLVVVGSEFSRTPALNTSNGKDHNPLTNSFLLAGGGIPSGLRVGESRVMGRNQHRSKISQHMALPVHVKTGQTATSRSEALLPEYQMLGPEQIWALVMNRMGGTPNKAILPRLG